MPLPDAVTHPSTNRDRRRLTSLIETNVTSARLDHHHQVVKSTTNTVWYIMQLVRHFLRWINPDPSLANTDQLVLNYPNSQANVPQCPIRMLGYQLFARRAIFVAKREYYQNCSVLGYVTQCSQSAAHLAYVSSSYRSSRLGLSHWDPLRCA